jgi:hypothetical protein
MIATDKELLKYVNYVDGSRTDRGITQQMTSSNTFYYDHNKLIKVEEFLIEGEKKAELNWYYWDDKPLSTSNPQNPESRAAFLLELSKTLLKQIIK